MPKRVRLIVNPASGQDDQILNKVNRVFYPADIDWEVALTRKSGDAMRFAQQAAEDGVDVVAAYGGDGTVMEVGQGLMGGETPMAILPGGTANVMSVEMGVPRPLDEAAAVILDENSIVQHVDVGRSGDRLFLLRIGIGFAADRVGAATREMKDRYGLLAYTIAAAQTVKDRQTVTYRLLVDGEEHEITGFSGLLYNSGNMGQAGWQAAPDVSVTDGLLDLFVVHDLSPKALRAAQQSIRGGEPDPNVLQHWQFKEISVETDPPSTIQGDGEMWGQTPFTAEVIPQAVPILTPPKAA